MTFHNKLERALRSGRLQPYPQTLD